MFHVLQNQTFDFLLSPFSEIVFFPWILGLPSLVPLFPQTPGTASHVLNTLARNFKEKLKKKHLYRFIYQW